MYVTTPFSVTLSGTPEYFSFIDKTNCITNSTGFRIDKKNVETTYKILEIDLIK